MKLLHFPKTCLNSTTRLFDYLTSTKAYEKLKGMDDVVICNLDSECMHDLYNDKSFYETHFGMDKFKVFIVHELDKGSIPFLKCADLIVFLTKNQQRNFRKIMKLNIPSVTIPYPIESPQQNNKSNTLSFLADFEPDYVKDYMRFVKTWGKVSQKAAFKIYDIDNNSTTSLRNTDVNLLPENLTAMFVVKDKDREIYEKFKFDFKCYACDNFENIKIVDSNEHDNDTLNQILSESSYCYIFNKELSQNTFDKLARHEDTRLIYTKFMDNYLLCKAISYKCKIIIADGISTWEKHNRPTINQYTELLIKSINKYRGVRKNIIKSIVNKLPIDSKENINIVYESKDARNSDYVFIVNFRNQSDKIIRCLKSINAQCCNINATIIITDDCSIDDSRSLVESYIANKNNCKYLFISNNDRKYASRNLYNAVTNFVENQNAIIIEIDGDDYLNHEYPVIYLLDTQYDAFNNNLTTHGQLIAKPSDFQGMETYNNVFDINSQWHQNKCASWLPLRTYRKYLFDKVEILYFVDMETGEWLKSAHDVSIHSRMIELANGKVGIIKHPIYVYDCSGMEHDVVVDDWSPIPSYRKLYHVITY